MSDTITIRRVDNGYVLSKDGREKVAGNLDELRQEIEFALPQRQVAWCESGHTGRSIPAQFGGSLMRWSVMEEPPTANVVSRDEMPTTVFRAAPPVVIPPIDPTRVQCAWCNRRKADVLASGLRVY